MDAYPLMRLCEKIRNRAKTESIAISRETKVDEWKNGLLDMISDNVILKQLLFIHPFQFAEELSSTSWFVFRLPFYRYCIYVKLNMDITKVISFHYDELPQLPKEVNTLFINSGTERVQIIEDGTAADKYLPIILGSSLIKLYPNKVYREADGTAYVDVDYLKLELLNGNLIQKNILERLSTIPFDVDFLDITPEKVNILSWVNEDEALQTVSLLSDVYNSHPSINWLQDICVDILLSNTDLTSALTIYNQQLHPTMPLMSPVKFDNSIETIIEEDEI